MIEMNPKTLSMERIMANTGMEEELQKKQDLLTNLTEDKGSMSKLNSIFEPLFFNECIDVILLLTSFSLLCILIFLLFREKSKKVI